MLPPLPRCSGWAYSTLISPSHVSLPRKGHRVGLHIVLFEACSAFTRVAACTLARSPYFVTRYPKASDISSPPCLLRLLPAGAVAGWDLHPLESAAFSRRTPKAAFRLNHLKPSTTNAGHASNGSKRARARSDGRGCHAARSPPTRVRLQLHALAYNLGNFLRTLATPEPIKDWSLTSLKEKADQDRREGREPWPLCRVSDGRSRHSQKSLRQHPTKDRRTSTAARSSACVKCSVVMRSGQTHGRDAS